MRYKSIVRSKGGTKEREVKLKDLIVPDIPMSPAIYNCRRGPEIYRLVSDVADLIMALQLEAKLPERMFVPDLWHAAMRLPDEEQELVLELWHFSLDLVRGTGYDEIVGFQSTIPDMGSSFVRGRENKVEHTVFLSHQSRDKSVVRRVGDFLHTDMEVIFDEWSFRPGKTLTSEIEDGIIRATALVLFWSESAAISKYVQFEDELAIARKIKDETFSIQVVRLDDTKLPERYSRLVYHDWRKGRVGSKLFKSHLKRLSLSIHGLPLGRV